MNEKTDFVLVKKSSSALEENYFGREPRFYRYGCEHAGVGSQRGKPNSTVLSLCNCSNRRQAFTV